MPYSPLPCYLSLPYTSLVFHSFVFPLFFLIILIILIPRYPIASTSPLTISNICDYFLSVVHRSSFLSLCFSFSPSLFFMSFFLSFYSIFSFCLSLCGNSVSLYFLSVGCMPLSHTLSLSLFLYSLLFHLALSISMFILFAVDPVKAW